jgi:hypothetical protein
MSKSVSILLASGLALVGATSLADAARNGSAHPRRAAPVVPVLGPAVTVAPGQFVKAFAYCPRGYYVTGGGAYSGAITEIVSSPTKDLRGWFVDGTNDDPLKRTFQHRADAVCVKGSRPLFAKTAAAYDARLVREAELAFSSARHRSAG